MRFKDRLPDGSIEIPYPSSLIMTTIFPSERSSYSFALWCEEEETRLREEGIGFLFLSM